MVSILQSKTWIKKQDLTICCLQETHLTIKDKHRLKVKGWKKIFQANGAQSNQEESYSYLTK
jgi:hypothetical protein